MPTFIPACPPTFRGENLFLAPRAPKQLKRVLIANRGEIALRIIRTCQQLGVETVAVYSDVDASAPYVTHATYSVYVGKLDGERNPYMNQELLIKTALDKGCDAIAPGYGYLSENADFADAVVATEKIKFLGPQGEVMRSIGEKSRSKKLLRDSFGENAPLVPGYHGDDQTDETLRAEALKIGFPLMIKASFGGGGRGMRIVRDASNLESEIRNARNEANRYFGSPILLMERYIEGGKHIEVQIFGDNHGNLYVLGERECSVQRRHQKIIEESPSPSLPENVRAKLFKAAHDIGKLLSYQNAGTIEFIYDPKSHIFSFLEVNTRLQVEHTITEMVTGIDLVSLQIYVGGGGDLSKLPKVTTPQIWGHAIECRLCAEEPGANFAPRTGVIRALNVPSLGQPGVRFDSAFEEGATISIHFDAMIGKLVAHSSSRELAIEKMRTILETTVCMGVPTNMTFMNSCLSHQTFIDGTYNTNFVPVNLNWLLQRPVSLSRSLAVDGSLLPISAIAPAFHVFQHLRRKLHPARSGLSPGFRLSQQQDCSIFTQKENYVVTLPDGGASFDVMLEYTASGADTFQLAFWSNQSDFAAESASKEVEKRYGSKLKPKALEAQKAAVERTAKFYGGLTSRDGLEGRQAGQWNHGVKEEEVTKVRSTLISSKINLASLPITGTSQDQENNRWINASLKLDLNGSISLFVLSTDHTFQEHETEPQVIWLWSPILAGPIKIVRRSLRAYAAEAQSTSSDESEGAGYATPMPTKILEILVQSGKKVEEGEALLICESMKIESTVRASKSGYAYFYVKSGDTVPQGRILCSISDKPPQSDAPQEMASK